MSKHRASRCLFGLALGDALGASTEFLTVDEIMRQFPPQGYQSLKGDPALVTDDTQMTLAVGEALVKATRPMTAISLEPSMRSAFIDWLRSPDNNRAPGNTCLSACDRLASGLPWHQATMANSKGCGANMRVAPVGLLPLGKDGVDEISRAAMVALRTAFGIAQFQAAMTHGQYWQAKSASRWQESVPSAKPFYPFL